MSLKRWHVDTVTLAMDGGNRIEMVAEVRGEWAYGKTPEAARSMFVWGYQVMHVPTGRLVRAGLQRKDVARKIVLRLSRLPEWPSDEAAQRKIGTQAHTIAWEEIQAADDRAIDRWKRAQESVS